LSHGIEGSPNKEGKEFVKFVDGLGNLDGIRAAVTATELVLSGLVDPYDLLTEILAMQQSQKRFWRSFDPVEYILFKTNLSCTVPVCHQSNTRNPWMLARETMSCPMNRSLISGFPN
jgi:hypothetical protein